ncbi:protease secretion system outer membrane protein [Duganella sp. SG902]|uniref:TolC family outer membrane protein n=1 Tax=Duganella sp. SG902 TaxID=2587016 RepID=UPI00181C9A2D|nr:protease secretion system outer membrane protein [Duganella sp. SG902]
MFKPSKLLPLAAGCMLLCANASAMSLMQAYEAALKNDPVYRSAFYQAEGGKENRILGRSSLLPSVSINYSGSQNRNTIEYFGKTQAQDYNSRNATVQVRQPLFSVDAWSRYKQGKAQSEQAEAQFASQNQEVIMRVVSSYLEALLKEDQLALARTERDMYAEQMKVNALLYKKGEGTRTDELETRSRLDLAEASVLEAEDALKTALDTLSGVVGEDVKGLDHLRPGYQVSNADLQPYEEWKKTALAQNPDIQALAKGVEVASQEINKQRAGHFPRLDLTATYGKLDSDTTSTIDEKTKVRSVGFQLTIPLYQGGAVSAATRQAAANRGKAQADLEAEIDKSLVELRRNYNQVTSSVARINALLRAVESAKLLITATEQSIKGGVRINLDLLTAQRQLVTAQRDLAQARYTYMLAALRLRSEAGVLSAEDVRLLAAHFE